MDGTCDILVQLEVLANCAKIFGPQTILIGQMLGQYCAVIKTHFMYQQQIINQTIKPFLPKVAQAEQLHTEALGKFLAKRQLIKGGIRQASEPLANVQKRIADAMRDAGYYNARESPVDGKPSLEQEYLVELYKLYVRVETLYMESECKVLDDAECLLLYTREQFMNEFKRTMDGDECRTLKYQLIEVSKVYKDNLNRLNVEWSDFADMRLKKLQQTYALPPEKELEASKKEKL